MHAMATALLVLLLAAPVVHGAQFTVGDGGGWTSVVDYTNWASDKTFTVGDTLVFNYDTSHKVDEVEENEYNSCSSSKVLKSHAGTTATITLSKSGTFYYICPTAGHCANGMKLQVKVVEASTPGGGSPSPPTTPTASPPSPGTTTRGSNPPPPPPPPSGAAGVGFNIMLGVLVVLATSFLVALMG